MNVLAELKNRGVAEVCFVCCDGLTGLPDAITTVWPAAIVQTCIVHLIRASMRYSSKKHITQVTAALRPIYQAPTLEAAAAALDALEEARSAAAIRRSPGSGGRPGTSSPRFWPTRWRSGGFSTPRT
jgi:transposase-like protein